MEGEAESPRRRGRTAVLVAVILTAVIVGVSAFSVGRLSTLADPMPVSTSAEAGFARDMQVHHDQGVQLGLLIRDRSIDEAVRLLGYDIVTTQGQQSGQMFGWLSVWGLSQAPPEASMTWMTLPGSTDGTHDNAGAHQPGDPMPGLATDAQMASLTAASGVEADRIFLTLMIAHHEGAIDMAEAVLDRTGNSVVRSFATAVVASQQSEIKLMTEMLAARA
ncbi:DUF305 domain-containing protein [Cryobacterium psychrophilum]|uniref:DUF305 domain-containing protein n=1 Tax=Cryobacterium psychrophilum TaxID=41988 RepID=UPI0010E9A030|nr:DUF305 domain-containing protein [Cryobacterium psychrophilum]TDW30459.1 uncharacterized protein (DUF305 family) [Cryobacterium psychrophilum]